MIDDFLELIGGLVKQSCGTSTSSTSQSSNHRWKHCVALAARGWKAYDFEAVPSEDGLQDDVIIKWKKEGVELDVKLSFTEQQLWLNYLDKKENDNES